MHSSHKTLCQQLPRRNHRHIIIPKLPGKQNNDTNRMGDSKANSSESKNNQECNTTHI